ncbi:MAG TPA: response regulator [Ktedonobacteraceae bacterium]|nr:response regulator [Ktedonobacteraceae bacterium]
MEGSKKRVLIADDDPAILDVLTLFLEEVGYEVESTINPETIGEFSTGYPDLMILDIWMSGWNGLDICRTLKGQATTRQLPIILFSAKKEAEELAYEAGADDFIAKPFNLDDMLDKVERFFKDS